MLASSSMESTGVKIQYLGTTACLVLLATVVHSHLAVEWRMPLQKNR